MSLVPFDFRLLSPHIAVEVLWDGVALGVSSPVDFVANVFLLIPLGFFTTGYLEGFCTRRFTQGFSFLTVCLFSLSMEGLQVFVPDRIPSLTDVAAQLGGAFVGSTAWRRVWPDIETWMEERRGANGHSDAANL